MAYQASLAGFTSVIVSAIDRCLSFEHSDTTCTSGLTFFACFGAGSDGNSHWSQGPPESDAVMTEPSMPRVEDDEGKIQSPLLLEL